MLSWVQEDGHGGPDPAGLLLCSYVLNLCRKMLLPVLFWSPLPDSHLPGDPKLGSPLQKASGWRWESRIRKTVFCLLPIALMSSLAIGLVRQFSSAVPSRHTVTLQMVHRSAMGFRMELYIPYTYLNMHSLGHCEPPTISTVCLVHHPQNWWWTSIFFAPFQCAVNRKGLKIATEVYLIVRRLLPHRTCTVPLSFCTTRDLRNPMCMYWPYR